MVYHSEKEIERGKESDREVVVTGVTRTDDKVPKIEGFSYTSILLIINSTELDYGTRRVGVYIL